MHFTVWLFMAMQASVAFSQTEKTDSITPKDSTQTVKIERKDSIPLKTTDRMLKEVVIFGRRPSIKFNLKDNSINAQLQNIRPGNLSFNVLGFLGYLFNVSSTNSEQCKLCVNGPLYIDARLLWKQAIGSNCS